MARKHRKERHSSRTTVAEREEVEVLVVDESDSDGSLSDHQLARRRLRQRWELASVLNFLHVFEPVIRSDLKMSAEEIETALISPNADLGRIHLALLKGILPIKKNSKEPDAWVTVVRKQLDSWWPWVAEGENPLKTNHGEETRRYKELDPTARLMILKATCELRADQDDILRHITERLKEGETVMTFRKEKIGVDTNGATYWYDGDPIIGHRLYKELVRFDSKRKLKENGLPVLSAIHSQWETLATNLEEFQEISEHLLSSRVKAEALVGEKIKTEILPHLEELEKKKERKLKRQLRQAMMLESFHNNNRIGINRTCRERKRVCYTFEEYDRSIKEAIQMTEKSETNGMQNNGGEGTEHANSKKRKSSNEVHAPEDSLTTTPEIENADDRHQDTTSEEDIEDDVYGESDAHDSISEPDNNKLHLNYSNKEDNHPSRTQKEIGQKVVAGLRRSARNAINTSQSSTNGYTEARSHAEMKKRLRQRPTHNPDFTFVSDSEDSLSPTKQTQVYENSGVSD